MTNSADPPPSASQPAWLDSSPEWLEARQPEDPAAAVAERGAKEAAGRERLRLVRQQAFVGGPLMVLGVLLTLRWGGPSWLVPLGVVLILLALALGPLTVVRAHRVDRRLAERSTT